MPLIYTLIKRWPKYMTGHAININMLSLSLLLTIIYVKWENRKRANGERDNFIDSVFKDALGHTHPSFRYTV